MVQHWSPSYVHKFGGVKEDREATEANLSLEFAKKASEPAPLDMEALASNNHGLFEYAKNAREPISSPMDGLDPAEDEMGNHRVVRPRT